MFSIIINIINFTIITITVMTRFQMYVSVKEWAVVITAIIIQMKFHVVVRVIKAKTKFIISRFIIITIRFFLRYFIIQKINFMEYAWEVVKHCIIFYLNNFFSEHMIIIN